MLKASTEGDLMKQRWAHSMVMCEAAIGIPLFSKKPGSSNDFIFVEEATPKNARDFCREAGLLIEKLSPSNPDKGASG
jgi:hypothetical protein